MPMSRRTDSNLWIRFATSVLGDGGGGQPLMPPSSSRTSSLSGQYRVDLSKLDYLFFVYSSSYCLSRSAPVLAPVHRFQVPRKLPHVRVVRVWGSPLLLPIAHVSRTSVCRYHRPFRHLSSISGFSGTQISSVFRQRRTASPRSTSWKADPHGPYYQSHTWDPSSFGTIVRDIVPALPTDAARFPAQ
jgi:hypothetical protein